MKIQRMAALVALFSCATAGAMYGCSSDKPASPAANTDAGPTPTTTTDPTSTSTTPPPPADAAPSKFTATAAIKPTSDASVVNGTATFTEENGEVVVVVNMTTGFPPGAAGLHGMHIHQNANCDTSDAGTVTPGGGAGGHWNPTDAGHGLPGTSPHHLGDMGNILVTDAGGTLTLISKEWTVKPGPSSVVGHAIVFHQQIDDGVSQPVGDAGARPGCGVIVAQ